MLGIKRKALESWVEWNTRSLRYIRTVLARQPELRWSGVMLKMVWRLHGYMIRRQDDSTALLHWRNLAWWQQEQQCKQCLRHPRRYNAMLETERMLNAVAAPWQETAQARHKWSELEAAFLKRFDVGWATGHAETSPTGESFSQLTLPHSIARNGDLEPNRE